MSVKDITRFYDALARDEALQDKFKALVKKHEGQKPDEEQVDAIYEKELLPFAKGAGYDFTLEELKEYRPDAAKPATRKLSDEELAAVAGGAQCVCVIVGYGNFSSGQQCGCVGYGWGQDGAHTCFCVLGGGA